MVSPQSVWVGRKSEVAYFTFLYSSRVWSRMGPFIHHSPMEATTSVIVPTLARIAFFNSAALSSEAREREEEGEREGGREEGVEEGEGRRKRERVEEGRGREKEGEGGRGEREGEGRGWKRGEGRGRKRREEGQSIRQASQQNTVEHKRLLL